MKKITFVLIFVLAFSTIATAMNKVDLSVQEMIIQPHGEDIIHTNNFHDETMAFQFRLSWFCVRSKISNPTDNIMFVSWQKSAFVDVNGNSHKVVPGQTLVIDITREVPDTMIPPHTSAQMDIYPHGFWKNNNDYKMILDYPFARNLFGVPVNISSKKSKEYHKFARKYSGQSLGLILCLTDGEGKDLYYNFKLNLDFDKGLEKYLASGGESEYPGFSNEKPAPNVGLSLESNVISEVKEGSLAEKAGLQKGDRIIEVNGKKIDKIENPEQYIKERATAGFSVMIMFDRSGITDLATLKQ